MQSELSKVVNRPGDFIIAADNGCGLEGEVTAAGSETSQLWTGSRMTSLSPESTLPGRGRNTGSVPGDHPPLPSRQVKRQITRQRITDTSADRLQVFIDDCEHLLKELLGKDDYHQSRTRINSISRKTLKLIFEMTEYQDNNDEYFQQLRQFQLPTGYHSEPPDAALDKFKTLCIRNFEIYSLLMMRASKLDNEFGVCFSPSSVWMDVAARKLQDRGLNKGLEVMAGKGLLSYFLKEKYGFDITASDNFKTHQNIVGKLSYQVPIKVHNEEALRSIEQRRDAQFLIISWPPGDQLTLRCRIINPNDTRLLEAWSCRGPILFIGVTKAIGQLWITGSEAFHQYLNQHYQAEIIEEYRGRTLADLDHAVLFIPKPIPKTAP